MDQPNPSQALEALVQDADAAYRRGDLDRAQASYEAVLRLDPDHAHAWNRVGAILAQRGDLEAAQRALERALSLNPRLAAAHSNLGNVHYQRGDYTQALLCYQQAIALDPRNPVFYENLHAAYKRLGQIDRAVDALKRARALDREVARDEVRAQLRHAARRLGCTTVLAALALVVGTVAALVRR